MKRIRLDRNKFITLFQTISDFGQPIGFQIYRRPTSRHPLLAAFQANQEAQARAAFERVTLVLLVSGPPIATKSIRYLANRSPDLTATERADKSSPPRARARRKKLS